MASMPKFATLSTCDVDTPSRVHLQGAGDIQAQDLERILDTFPGLNVLILQDGSGLVSLPVSVLPPPTRTSLRRLLLADREYPPFSWSCLETWPGWRDAKDTLCLIGVKDLAELPPGRWAGCRHQQQHP
jgi:hypothetical protein